MGLFTCAIHGEQSLVSVSNRFAEACNRKERIPADWVCLVVILSPDRRAWWNFVDVDIVQAAGLEPGNGPLILHDRNRATKQLNDRLLIRKIFSSNSVRHECKECLAQAIEPRDASHLKGPMSVRGQISPLEFDSGF